MDQFEQMKVTRQAMNGKMCLMFGGIFLMFSAITSTIMYGINFCYKKRYGQFHRKSALIYSVGISYR